MTALRVNGGDKRGGMVSQGMVLLWVTYKPICCAVKCHMIKNKYQISLTLFSPCLRWKRGRQNNHQLDFTRGGSGAEVRSALVHVAQSALSVMNTLLLGRQPVFTCNEPETG